MRGLNRKEYGDLGIQVRERDLLMEIDGCLPSRRNGIWAIGGRGPLRKRTALLGEQGRVKSGKNMYVTHGGD